MFERWKKHRQMRKQPGKSPQAPLKGIWIEHKGKRRVNLCS
jgi:hypothetical protein